MKKKKFVIFASLILAIFFFIICSNQSNINNRHQDFEKIEESNIYIDNEARKNEKEIIVENIAIEKKDKNETKEKTNKEEFIGTIEIPKISLDAKIKEGTSKSVIDNYVGHFETTSLDIGNIGLAAHNRGWRVKDYFRRINELEVGDEIIYKTNKIIRKYHVTMKKTIKDTDWNYLKNTADNRITLITCVQNIKNLRLCVQAVEFD